MATEVAEIQAPSVPNEMQVFVSLSTRFSWFCCRRKLRYICSYFQQRKIGHNSSLLCLYFDEKMYVSMFVCNIFIMYILSYRG